jgi:hypothetical protein
MLKSKVLLLLSLSSEFGENELSWNVIILLIERILEVR